MEKADASLRAKIAPMDAAAAAVVRGPMVEMAYGSQVAGVFVVVLASIILLDLSTKNDTYVIRPKSAEK